MPLNLTEEQRIALKERLASGAIDPNGLEAKQLVVEKFKGDPLLFAQKFLAHHMLDQATGLPSPSPAFHQEMIDSYLKHSRIAFAAPRGHAKSTITTLFYVLYVILFQQKKNIVLISSTEDMAIRFLRRIKDELDTNKLIIWLFGHLKSDKWAETEFRTTTGIVVNAKGKGAQLRGLIDGANRPDLIIMDDVEDEEQVRSELRRYDLESWFNGTVLPTLSPVSGQVIIVGTILHMDSLLNRAVTQDPVTERSIAYPEFHTKVFRALNDVNESLWPERFSAESINKIKDSYLQRGQLTQFYMEWMNDPTPEENATFKHFTYFDKRDLPTLLNIECFVDVGGGSVKKGADDTAITITGTDQDNVMYVIDYFSEQTGTNTDTIIDEMFRLDNLYHPKRFLIEKSQAANFLVSPLEKRQLNDRHFLNIEYVSPPKGSGDRRGNMSDGKYQRIAAMASPFKLGAIRIQKWMTKLIDQATRFPRATHDDVLDATAYSWMFSQKNMRPWEQRTPSITDDLFGPEPSQEYEPLYADIGV